MYKFIKNYFTHAIPQAEEYLKPYVGNKAHFLEIGSFEGRSTIWFLDNILTHPVSYITCVDPWIFQFDEPIFENFKHNISFHPGKVIYYQDTSSNVLVTLVPEYYDFVYVDGDHTSRGVFEDAVLSFRLLKSGGIMAFNDYSSFDPNHTHDGTFPKEAVDAFLNAYKQYLTVLHKDWQVWLVKH